MEELERDFGIAVVAVATLDHLQALLAEDAGLAAYRERYGAVRVAVE